MNDVSAIPGEGWDIGPDGMPHRLAARLLLFDHAGRVLLARGHDAQQPSRSWWFTVGGGIEPGESAKEAAVRELHEESGLRIDPALVAGPVATRSAVFDFLARRVRQDEEFFVARLEQAAGRLDTRGWTDVERSFMDELRWFTLEELGRVRIEVFPTELPGLLAWLRDGWDGRVRSLPPQLE